MVDNSLPKEIILRHSAEFAQIFQHGACLKNDFVAIFFIKSDQLKVGFAAKSSRATKPARNRLKRIARELWRVSFRKYNLAARFVILINSRALQIEHKTRLAAFQHLLGIVEEKLTASTLAEKAN